MFSDEDKKIKNWSQNQMIPLGETMYVENLLLVECIGN